MKKKTIALALVVCLGVVMGLTGCGNTTPYGKYNLSDYIKIGQYKGLTVEAIAQSVSTQEVQTQVKANVAKTKTKKQVKTGTVKKGDSVNIDYTGTMNGKAFSGGSAKGYDLTIGSNSFIPGFETGLTGKAVGSTHKLHLKFPSPYAANPDLAGKAVVFTVKINYITKEITPKYDEAWIKANSQFATKAAYEADVKAGLLKNKQDTEKQRQISQLMQDVVTKTKVLKYPQTELNAYMQAGKKQAEAQAQQYGMTLSAFLTQNKMTQAQFNSMIKQQAEDYVKLEMVIFYIADKEKLTFTKTEQSNEEKNLLSSISQQGITQANFKDKTGFDFDAYVQTAVMYGKVSQLIYSHAKIVDKAAQATTPTTAAPTTKATQATKSTNDKGADNATSNHQPGGADA